VSLNKRISLGTKQPNKQPNIPSADQTIT